jgi:8-amino-7-oxononanoate synthase
MTWDAELARRIAQRHADNLFRRRISLTGAQGPRITTDGGSYLSFCSNDYLGLASDPRLIRALQQAANQYGVGAGASHLVTGHQRIHDLLEQALADFVGAPRALLFSTGYMANLGIANALLGRGDLLIEDRLNHASLIDAGLLCRAQLRRYPHADVAVAQRLLATSKAERKLILTDAVFSMDGDLAPVPNLIALAVAHNARIMLDDAHGLGVLGAEGRGSLEHHSLSIAPPVILMGTLGKALGTFGAFVAGDEALIETLIQDARTYIYTTAPPPAVAAATCEALRIVRDEPWRRERLRNLVQRFRRGAGELGLPLANSDTPIQPIIIGEPQQALAISRGLKKNGVLVTAIRPPTVPLHTSRLRVTFSAGHSEQDVDQLLDALSRVMNNTH